MRNTRYDTGLKYSKNTLIIGTAGLDPSGVQIREVPLSWCPIALLRHHYTNVYMYHRWIPHTTHNLHHTDIMHVHVHVREIGIVSCPASTCTCICTMVVAFWPIRSLYRRCIYVYQIYIPPCTCRCIPYTTNFSLDKNFAKPSYLCIAEIFSEINFRQCSKGCHILNAIINIGQKICVIKFRQ